MNVNDFEFFAVYKDLDENNKESAYLIIKIMLQNQKIYGQKQLNSTQSVKSFYLIKQ